MATLFGRELSLNIAGTLIKVTSENRDALRVGFKVVRANSKEPNGAEIIIHNLSPSNRTKFQQDKLPTVLQAGYVGNISTIFNGSLDFGQNTRPGTDWITSLQASDGGPKFRSARINTSRKGPAKIGDVLRDVANAMGIGLGNTNEKINEGAIRGKLTEFVNGIVLSGKAEVQLDKVLKSMGYKWSIQDGQLQLLGPNETIGSGAILLKPGTGMVGTPEAGEKGFVKVRSLLQPELTPGRRVKIESKRDDVSGFFRVEKAIFVGDTWSNDWYVDMECKPL